MDLGLQGKKAVVTAASRGFGRAVAEELAAEGADVLICSRTESDIEQVASEIRVSSSVNINSVAADISTARGCETVINTAREKMGGIDILICNTGGPAKGHFHDLTDDDWAAGFQNTLMNIIRLVRITVPEMEKNHWGRIVNIASITAHQPIPGLTISNALRPAIVGLAKDLADELAPRGILVNNVLPGYHLTDRLLTLAGTDDLEIADEYFETVRREIPLGRLGRPRELAAAVAFLCSERASFITGTSLVVDGGHCRGLC